MRAYHQDLTVFQGMVFSDGQILPAGFYDQSVPSGASDVILNPFDQTVDGNRSGNQQQWLIGRVRIIVEVVETSIKWTRVLPRRDPFRPECHPKRFQFGCAHGPLKLNEVDRHFGILPWCKSTNRLSRASGQPQGLRLTPCGTL
jgi:hypothetical protein